MLIVFFEAKFIFFFLMRSGKGKGLGVVDIIILKVMLTDATSHHILFMKVLVNVLFLSIVLSFKYKVMMNKDEL